MAQTPDKTLDATKLHYSLRETLRLRSLSDSAVSIEPSSDVPKPFTPRINPVQQHAQRSGDIHERLYEMGLIKLKSDIKNATLNTFLELEKVWSTFRSDRPQTSDVAPMSSVRIRNRSARGDKK
jgi:hypothetical protein